MASPTPNDLAPWVERLARVGYVAKGVLYITVGYLAAEAGLGAGGRLTDTEGALRVVEASYGRVLVFLIAAGLCGYAVWRLVEAVVDPERRGTTAKGVAVRLGLAARGLFHGFLGITAFRLALGDGSGASGSGLRQWIGRVFELPAGDFLVGLAGAWVAGYGVYQFYRAGTSRLRRHLRLGDLPERIRGLVLGFSRFGVAARGVVFCLIGWFLARAALRHEAGEAGGIKESLRALSLLGRWPFVLVAAGLVAYGVYQLVNARYRSIRVE